MSKINTDNLLKSLYLCGNNSSCDECCCEHYGLGCAEHLVLAAKERIEALQAELATVKAERVAALSDVRQYVIDWWKKDTRFPCGLCKHKVADGRCEWKTNHPDNDGCFGTGFEWRGVRSGGGAE